MDDKNYPPLHASAAGTKEIVVAICFLTLAFVAVILRIWSRVLKARRLALNDYAVFAALICSSGTASIMIWCKLSKHSNPTTAAQAENQQRYTGQGPGNISKMLHPSIGREYLSPSLRDSLCGEQQILS
jgi:hypothetical protein